MVGFVVMVVIVVVGMGMDAGAGGGANRDRDNGLIGYAAAVPLCEYSQALQNTCEQRIDDRASDGCRGCRVMVLV